MRVRELSKPLAISFPISFSFLSSHAAAKVTRTEESKGGWNTQEMLQDITQKL